MTVRLALTILLYALAVLGHGYFWTDLVNRMHAWSGPRKLIDVLTLLCLTTFLLLPLAVVGRVVMTGSFSGDLPSSPIDAYPLLCAAWGVYCLVRNAMYERAADNPEVLVDWKQESQHFDWPNKTELFGEGLPRWLSHLPRNQILQLTIDRKQLAIPHLNSRLAGLKLAHISDLHMTGRIDLPWFEFVTEQVASLDADAVFITGDIVEKEACWPWLARTLGALRAPLGVYYILGNHDYYIDIDHTKHLLNEQGLICLSERWLATEWNGVPVQLGGNELPWATRAADFENAPSLRDDTIFRLALLHTPDQFAWACKHQAQLALAGHTHGGQLRFPILGPIVSPSRYGTRYACGVFQRDQTTMHVSRGVTGKTPLRWNCPPEIALLELTHMNHSR